MKKRITIPAVFLIILVIILLLFKCGGGKEQTSEQSTNVDQETYANIQNDTVSLISDAEKNAEDAEKEEQLKAEMARKREQDLIRRSQKSMERYIHSLKPRPQVIFVSRFEVTTVTGEKGTKIHVNPSVLETSDGSQPTDSIRVELVEVIDQQDMLLHNLQTMAGDSILISDGMFRLEMFSGNEQLSIKEGRSLFVEFPQNSLEYMDIFYGVPDATGSPDWELDTTGGRPTFEYQGSIEPIPSELENSSQRNYINRVNYRPRQTEEQLRRRRIYINRLGWVNLDTFLRMNTPRSVLTIRYKSDSIKAVRCNLIFTDLNALLKPIFKSTPINYPFRKFPANQNIRILAIGYRDSIPFISDKEVYINKELTHELIFERTTEKELTERLNSLEIKKK